MQTTNSVGQRRNNLAVLSRAIWRNPGISRRELVESFEIDESSVSRLVSLLLSMGLIEATGSPDDPASPKPSLGGRPRVALRIKPDFGQAWGLTLWRDRVRVTIADAQGESLAASELRLDAYDGDWGAYLDRAIEFASSLSLDLPGSPPLLGIGFGVPGWIDSETATIVESLEFGLFKATCPRRWDADLPILWENDANCGAWSGLARGAPAADEMLVLGRFLEHGPLGLPSELSVGFGLVIGGQLHRGWRHKAGEFRSALRQPSDRLAFGVDEATFAASRTDRGAFLETVGELMRNMVFVSQFLDPRVIHLGGDLKDRIGEVLEACERIDWPEAASLLRPLSAEVDEVSTGAALLVLDELFQLPGKNRRILFRGYGSGVNDPLWRGIPVEDFVAKARSGLFR